MPAEAERGEREVRLRRDARVEGLAHGGRGRLRMNEDWDAQLRRHRQHGAQVGMVEMPLPRAAAQERPP